VFVDIVDGGNLNTFVKQHARLVGVEFVIKKSKDDRRYLKFACARGIRQVPKESSVPPQHQRKARSKRVANDLCGAMFVVTRQAVPVSALPPHDVAYSPNAGDTVWRYVVSSRGCFSMAHNHNPMEFPPIGPMDEQVKSTMMRMFSGQMDIRSIRQFVF